MALSDNAVMLPGRGYFFTHPTIGSAPPADTIAELNALDLTAATIGTGWVNGGHTSRENAVALDKEGDEAETKGTWQAPALRNTTPVTVWKIGVPALQFDNENLARYFGEGDITDPDVFHVLSGAASVEEAMFLVLVDGSTRAAIYKPKVSFTSDDTPEFDPEEFVEFPTIGTILEHTGAPGLMSWYKAGLGTPA